jgi:hypothetical protein
MTLPNERYRAILNAEQFLKQLLVDDKMPKEVRENARWCLRHYPTKFDLDEIARACPDVLAEEYRIRADRPAEVWNKP